MDINGYPTADIHHLRMESFFHLHSLTPEELAKPIEELGGFFTIQELSLNGKRRNAMIGDTEFLGCLASLRRAVGRPFTVSNYGRTPEHNELVGGHPRSAHMAARGIDIKTPDDSFTWEVVCLAPLHGFYGIGIKSHGGSRYIHLDDVKRSGTVDGRVWSYG